MKTTTLLFVAVSGFAVSTAVLAEGFNDRGPDYTPIIAYGKASTDAVVAQTAPGFNDRGVDVVAASATAPVRSGVPEQWIAVRHGFNDRTSGEVM